MSRMAETISFDYLEEGLEMSVEEAERVKNVVLRDLQTEKKLCLVLDLDHTLLHTNFRGKPDLSRYEGDDIYEWKVMGDVYFTKLRPFVRKFLEEASQLFELYVYTMGTRIYASTVVGEFLDPDGVYFGNRVISREDCTIPGLKGLDIVPVHPSAVVILDDTECVWEGYLGNLLLVEKYDFFPQAELDESEDAGALSCALEVLTKLHSVYFEWYDRCRDCDVRELIQNHWEEIGDDEGQQGVGTGTCSSDMGCGKQRARVDDEHSSVTKKQRIDLLAF